MNPLSPTERRDLRALAHHLEPVVTVGHHGLTPAVLHEIDLALLAHDLVKVRVLGDDRQARDAMLAQACEALDCAPVQHVGKVLVLWRPNPERKKKAAKAAEPAKSPRAPARKRPAKRQPVDPVRERRRAARTQQEPPAGDQSRRRRRTV
jgi:putative YhbY family RNA-binding protein